MSEELDQRHRDEVVATYRAADRLRLYSVLSALLGLVLAVTFVGAVLIGWIDPIEGVTWVAISLLVALAPAAKFYADAMRTTLNAAGVERSLDMDEDLFAPTLAHRKHVRIAGTVGVVLALLATMAIAGYSADNADTREPGDSELFDDDDDDDDDTDENDGDDDDSDRGGSQPVGGDGTQPAGTEGDDEGDDDDGSESSDD